jgi:hypothetical protein
LRARGLETKNPTFVAVVFDKKAYESPSEKGRIRDPFPFKKKEKRPLRDEIEKRGKESKQNI